ncbi:MAG: hypothetical protein JJE28_05955 [Actinomycetales bacterium]|nr:hypothetical protein [Actinomycetales bacterium]
MSLNLTLPSEHDASDLRVFLERAAKLGCEHVRLIGVGPVLAAYVGVLVPSGLLDTAPTVLGLRVFERSEDAQTASASGETPNTTGANSSGMRAELGRFLPLDTVVTIRGMLDRLARPELTFALPVGEAGIAWAGVSAPRSGWEAVGVLSAVDLEAIARAGIDEIAGSNGLGTIIVTRARREVWGRPIFSGVSTEEQVAGAKLVSGAAFAAFGLGFLGEDQPQLSRSANWTRLTTARGHILVR